MYFLKKLWKKIEGQNRRKLIENTAIVIIIGIIIIIAGGTIFGNNRTKTPDTGKKAVSNDSYQLPQNTGDTNEAKLRSILSKMQGVGKVDVMITYSASSENVPAYDIKKNQSNTEEKDSGGGTRSIGEEEYNSNMAYEDSSGGKKPVILKTLEPEVKGVLVIAEGADSVEVRERICNAVTVVLDIPIHKVQVYKMQK